MTDLDAEHYRKNSSIQYTLAHASLSKLSFKGSEAILDVGCGDGRMTAELSKCVLQGKVIGIDPSSSMIDLACQSFPKREYPNLDFKKMAAENLEYASYFDITLILNSLHWMRAPLTALGNVEAALKPGGTLCILTYPKESPYWQFLEATLQEEAWAAYRELSAFRTIQSSQEYLHILTKLGLKIDHYSLEEEIAFYPSREALSNYIKGWLNCYLPLPKEYENKFLEKTVDHAFSFSLSSNSQEIHLPYLKLSIQALKY